MMRRATNFGSLPASAPAPAVEVHDAFCLHPLPDGGSVAALRGLSLSVAPGERLVVHGPNGSGKTTLMRALAGEQRLAAGRVVVAGLELSGASEGQLAAWRAARLGQVDQDPGRLLRPEFDVLGNVSLQLRVAGVPRAQARQRGLEALKRLGLDDLADRRPGTLSGGQVQRVAVCAALAHDPAVVLADEPTGELDAASADAVYELLATAVAQAGATLVMVTHDRRAQAVADRVVRIRDGRISETWHPERDLADPDRGGQPSEALVVDDRGWVRLPLAVRQQLGAPSQLRVSAGGDAITLRPVAPDTQMIAAVGPELEPIAGQAHWRASEPSSSTVPIASARGIQVSYQGLPVLGSVAGGGLDLDAYPGEMIVVAGRSGSGKSTLLRVLLGLQRPGAGQVTLNGVDMVSCSRAEAATVRAGCSAVVMQQVYLAGTADAEGNLDLARAIRGLPADSGGDRAWLTALGLTGEIMIEGRPVAGLSGGERQRLAVAQALSVQPALLVLDEPTSQLDEASAEQLSGVLRSAARNGAALVIASHDPVLIAAADRVIELT